MPQVSSITRWRQYPQTHRLEGAQCTACKKMFYPKQYLCTCGSKDFSPIILSGKGRIVTFSLITNPPKAFESEAPYLLAMVELKEKIKIIAQLTDTEINDVRIGMFVEATIRKLYTEGEKGNIQYGIKFKPV